MTGPNAWAALLSILFASLAAAADDALLFSFFRGNGEDGLYLAESEDGLLWTPLNSDRPLVRPEVGESKLMRDPSILWARMTGFTWCGPPPGVDGPSAMPARRISSTGRSSGRSR